MVITEVNDPDLESRLGHSDAPRTEGLHLSTVYKHLMETLQPDRFNSAVPMNMKRVEIGLLFENMLERAMVEKFAAVRPGELISDEGILMTPDGVNPALMAGEEYKATWMSSSKGISETVIIDTMPCDVPLPKFFHWFLQMLGYAKWLDVRTFLLRVLFVNGDYKWHESINPITGKKESIPTGPQFKSYRVTFTDQEVEDNWALLMSVAREKGLLT